MLLQRGDTGPEVTALQRALSERGYRTPVDGTFGLPTHNAVRAFQAQNLDQHGQPLVVDGRVGPLTWWSLGHPKPDLEPLAAIDYRRMPPDDAGGSAPGRRALAMAIAELEAGAGEIGGDNRGPFVAKYLEPAGRPEGEPWCASFVSWCFLRAADGDRNRMPFRYEPGARALLSKLKRNGWAFDPASGYQPVPGDLVFWWRVRADGWQGHVGFAHQLKDGMLYTIEGNKSPRVQGFSYVASRMEKLLGFGHVPDL